MARSKKKTAVPAGRRSTTSGSGTTASQRHAGRRKANELASSGDSTEPANRRPAPGAGSAPLPASSSVTDERATHGSRQPGPSGVGATYKAVLAGPAAPSQLSGPTSPQPWIRNRPNPVSQWRHPIGARLTTCTGLLEASQMAPLTTPTWPTSAYLQDNVLTRRKFLFQVLVKPVTSWFGCGRPALAV